ncbi:MAG: class I SAM-dependent methyltransferase [Lachnospiraceae bacterium]|nr:class I SAM-dependent methyltransferase [Lachnospiraceae bacterium]
MKSFDENWEKIHATREWGQYPAEHVIRFVARNFYDKDRKKVKILDFGCGGGAHTWFLAREGFDTYAFDGSASAIKRVEEKMRKEGLAADLRVLDGTEIDYPDDFFDGIIDNIAICANRYEAIQWMYKNCYRILKSGGKIFTSCITPKTDGCGTGEKIDDNTFRSELAGVAKGQGVMHYFTEKELKNCLETIGFINIGIDELFYTDNGIKVDMLIAKAEKR